MIDFYADRTTATPWHQIGRCYLDYNHAVLAAVPTGDGWTVGGIKVSNHGNVTSLTSPHTPRRRHSPCRPG
jgi:hypothetical protein